MRNTSSSRLIVAASENNADMLHATRFFAPDEFIFLEKNGHRTIVLSDLEIDRGRKTAGVDEVVSYSEIAARVHPAKNGQPPFSDVVCRFLKDKRVRAARVPASFPLGLAQKLTLAGIRLIPESGLFWKEREFKTAQELKLLRRALGITESGMARAMEVLRASECGPKDSLRWAGKPLTSEILRAEIDSAILRAGGLPANTIVAGGRQACDPHERGSGPLRARSLIIIDIFPRDARSGYYGDLTRTVVRGQADGEQRRLWETVLRGQELALSQMKPGGDGRAIHESVKEFFREQGYPTERKNGRWTGFFPRNRPRSWIGNSRRASFFRHGVQARPGDHGRTRLVLSPPRRCPHRRCGYDHRHWSSHPLGLPEDARTLNKYEPGGVVFFC